MLKGVNPEQIEHKECGGWFGFESFLYDIVQEAVLHLVARCLSRNLFNSSLVKLEYLVRAAALVLLFEEKMHKRINHYLWFSGEVGYSTGFK